MDPRPPPAVGRGWLPMAGLAALAAWAVFALVVVLLGRLGSYIAGTWP